MANNKTPVPVVTAVAVVDNASKEMKEHSKKEAEQLENLQKNVEAEGLSAVEALDKATEILNEGIADTNSYIKKIMDAAKNDGSIDLKHFAHELDRINKRKEIIARILSSSIETCEAKKKITQKKIDELVKKYDTETEIEKNKIKKDIQNYQNQILLEESKKQKKIDHAKNIAIKLFAKMQDRLELFEGVNPAKLEKDRKKTEVELKEIVSKTEEGSEDFHKAIELMLGKKSKSKDDDDEEDDKNVPKWKKTINSIIEEDQFAGRALKAYYMAKHSKKNGGKISSGLLKAFKGDVHRSFQKWAYGGSGIGGAAKALLGRFIDSRLSARAEAKIRAKINSKNKQLEDASKKLEQLKKPNSNATSYEFALARQKYNALLRNSLMLAADFRTHGRASLTQEDSDLFGTSDESQILGKNELELLKRIRKETAEDERIIREESEKSKQRANRRLDTGFTKKAEVVVETPPKVSRLAIEGPKARPAAISQGVIDIVANEILPQGRNLGSHEGGIVTGLRAGMNALKTGGALIKGTPGGTIIPTLAGNRHRVAENSRAEAVLPMQGKVPALVGKAIAAAAGFGKKGTSTGGKMQYESTADHEARQQEIEDRHSIAQNVATIVEILQREERDRKKPEEKGFFQKILDAIMGLGALFGPTLAKIARFIKGIKSFLTGGKLFKSLAGLFGKSGLLGKIGKFFSGIFGKGGKIAAFFGKIGKFFAPITKLFSKGGFLGTIGKLFKGLAPLFKVFGPLIKTIAPFFRLLGKLFLPLQAILTGFDAFKGWTDKDLHKKLFGLKDGEEATTGQKYQATLSSIFSGLTGGLVSTEAVHKFLSTGFTGIFYNGLGKLIDFACDFFNAEDKWAFIKEKLGNVKDAIMEGIGRIGEWFSEKWTNAKEWVLEKIGSLWEGIKNCFSSIGEWIAEKASATWEWIKENNPLTLIWNGLGSIGQWISEKVSSAWEWIKENNPLTLIWNGLESIGKWISEKATAAWEWIKENNPITLLQNGFESIGKWISEKATAVWEFVKENNPFSLISKAFDDIKKWLEEHNPFGVIEEFFEGISEKFKKLNPFDWFGDDDEKKSKPKVEKQAPPEPPAIRQAHAKQGLDAYAAQGGVDWNGKPIARLTPVYDPKKTAVPSIAPIAAAVAGSPGAVVPGIGPKIAPIGAMIAGASGKIGGSGPTATPAIDVSKLAKSSDNAFTIEKAIINMDKNVESIYKMMRYIKVDGVMLGDLLDKKPVVPGMAGPGGAQQGPGGGGLGGGPGGGGAGGPGGFGGGEAGGPGGFGEGGKLGDTIARFESGNEGVMKIGYDKGGGTSYGKWQLSSKQGSYQEWLTLLGSGQYGEEGKRIAAKLKAAGPLNTGSRSGAAVDAYLQEAAAHKDLFEESQRASYTKNQYNVAFKLLKSDSLKQQIQNDKAFQEMLFSTAVQHGQGGASSIFNAVYRDGMSRNELIEAVYRERTRRFGHTARRYAEEKEVIKGMSPTASPSTGGPGGSVPVANPAGGGMDGGPVGQPAPSIPGSGGLAGIVQGMGSFKYGMYNKGGRYGRYNKLVKGADGRWHAGSGAGFASMDCSQFASAVMANAGYGAYVNQNGDASRAEDIRQDLKNKHMPLRTDLSQVQEGDIAFTIGGKHTGGGEAGHVAVVIKDPQTGAPMIAESTGSSTSIGGGLKISPLQKWVGYYSGKKRVEIYQSPISGKEISGPMAGGPAGPIGGALAGGNVKDAMGGVEQPGMGGVGGPGAAPQIQGSQQSNLAEAAGAFYANGGAGGTMNINAGSNTNILGGADKNKTAFITTKDPMGWIILQGNCVH